MLSNDGKQIAKAILRGLKQMVSELEKLLGTEKTAE